MKRILLTLLAALCLFGPQNAAAGPIRVMVSILPQVFFVEKIGGQDVHVQAMVQPGASPATYEPKPQQMVELSRADVYLAIGVPFERTWLDRFSETRPELRIVHTEKHIEKIPMDHGREIIGGRAGRKEPRAKEHQLDPHIWLSPSRVKTMARTIASVLKEIDPSRAETFDSRLETFLEELDRLDDRLTAVFRDHTGEPFLVYHPSWGYLAEDYNLRQVPIEYQGKSPTPARLRQIIEWARRENIQSLLVQPQFSQRQARTIAQAIGARLVQADPLAEDWAGNLLEVAERIAAGL